MLLSNANHETKFMFFDSWNVDQLFINDVKVQNKKFQEMFHPLKTYFENELTNFLPLMNLIFQNVM